ncbi:hypothetical protein [Robiginitalea biformata]|uniref:Lipoprotein n=1 Tax=Robiginitalea biformata (strain ATCC BAA-864 / DSM 15991 / KCTC 12146 / HTCC2501) TaxID=313596 RepID=A4CKL9_ROBBH|nr:hypothetical protein [Robiginitalea biformata]EAR15418.1 hypothetical protein RB2501_13859 [Robiginitalea biformata HTCC2501]
MKTPLFIIAVLCLAYILGGCEKDEPEQLASTALTYRQINKHWDAGGDRGLENFIDDTFQGLPAYSDRWLLNKNRKNRYALVVINPNSTQTTPKINGVPFYQYNGIWYIYSKQGGKQDRGDELIEFQRPDGEPVREFVDLQREQVYSY